MNDEAVITILEHWYEALKKYSGDFPARGTISGALVVLDHLKADYLLDIDKHTAKGGAQIKGASGNAIKTILQSFGETRPFVSEGGRTNRGLRGDIKQLLDDMTNLHLEVLPLSERKRLLEVMQRFLVGKVQDFHNRQRLKFVYSSSKTTRQLISDLLEEAKESRKDGYVAQYLVGAKLQMRFPQLHIENRSGSSADEQIDHEGDFLVGDTVIHVTVSPFPHVYEKCKLNISNGLRPLLLVSERTLIGARQNVDVEIPGMVAVESIESFVSQNLEEMAAFSEESRKKSLKGLLELYNQRVDEVEYDKSLKIEIPGNLR